MNLFLFALVGCCTGYSVLFARAYGQNDHAELRRHYVTALAVGAACTAALMLLGLAGMQGILSLLQTPQELRGYTAVYLCWIFGSMPAAFLYNLHAALLRASGDTQAALLILAAAVGTNLVLDLVLVAWLSLGIAGAAAATALTQVFSAVFCWLYLRRTHKELTLHRQDFHFQRGRLWNMFQLGFVTSLHQCSLYLGKMLVQGTVNTAGTEGIAAYTAATRIEGFANSVGTGGSVATSILTAQNFGAGNAQRVAGSFRCSAKWLSLLGALSGVLMFMLAPYAAALMLNAQDGAAFTSAVHYLRLVAVFYLFCFSGNSFTGYFDGIGAVIWPFIGSLGHIAIRVVLSAMATQPSRFASMALRRNRFFCNVYLWFCKSASTFTVAAISASLRKGMLFMRNDNALISDSSRRSVRSALMSPEQVRSSPFTEAYMFP